MTKDQILSDLFVSVDFNACIGKMKPEQLQDDLRSEVMLILCESSEEKIIGLHKAGGLTFYTVRIILNLIQSKTSPFYKKYRQPYTELKNEYNQGGILGGYRESGDEPVLRNTTDVYDSITEHLTTMEQESNQEYAGMVFSILEERERREKMEDQAMEAIEDLYWYEREMVKLYLKLGSYREIQAVTKIPFQSCYKTVKRACQKILTKVTMNQSLNE